MKDINIQRLEEIISQFKNKKIAVLGDLMLDEHIFGDTKRISPEAPVPVVNVRKITYMPGGAANTANNLKSLGAKVFLLGVIGKDAGAKTLMRVLNGKGIDTKGVLRVEGRPTTVKTRIISKNQHVVRVDRETREPILEEYQKKLLDFAKNIVNSVDIVIISDYAKGVVTPMASQGLIDIANSAKKKILVGPKGEDFSKYSNSFLIVPNLKELEIALKTQVKDLTALPKAMKTLLAHVGSKAVITTLGANGMALFKEPDSFSTISSTGLGVVDVSGAGDTAISNFALSLASGSSLEEAMMIATCACSVSIRKIGTATVNLDEMVKEAKKIKEKWENGRKQ